MRVAPSLHSFLRQRVDRSRVRPRRRATMFLAEDGRPGARHHHGMDRRRFLARMAQGGVAATAFVAGTRRRATAAETSPYPDWIAVSTKPPKRGGSLARASAWDPPLIDPRLTQSVGLY